MLMPLLIRRLILTLLHTKLLTQMWLLIHLLIPIPLHSNLLTLLQLHTNQLMLINPRIAILLRIILIQVLLPIRL